MNQEQLNPINQRLNQQNDTQDEVEQFYIDRNSRRRDLNLQPLSGHPEDCNCMICNPPQPYDPEPNNTLFNRATKHNTQRRMNKQDL